jgi:predicted metal-dependent HD superfamily phosphohydrolase
MNLKTRFEELLSYHSSDTLLVRKLWNELNSKYLESFRAYHNLNHLEEIFNYFDQYQALIEKPTLLALSIFYHDSIYSIWSNDNEEKSAAYAKECLELIGLDNADISIIQEQIIATKTHTGTSKDTLWMIDFDIAILGQSWNTYEDYTKKIRLEYNTVPSFIYKKGRKKVLQHFLKKEFIYSSTIFQETFETNAKENLTKELKSL